MASLEFGAVALEMEPRGTSQYALTGYDMLAAYHA